MSVTPKCQWNNGGAKITPPFLVWIFLHAVLGVASRPEVESEQSALVTVTQTTALVSASSEDFATTETNDLSTESDKSKFERHAPPAIISLQRDGTIVISPDLGTDVQNNTIVVSPADVEEEDIVSNKTDEPIERQVNPPQVDKRNTSGVYDRLQQIEAFLAAETDTVHNETARDAKARSLPPEFLSFPIYSNKVGGNGESPQKGNRDNRQSEPKHSLESPLDNIITTTETPLTEERTTEPPPNKSRGSKISYPSLPPVSDPNTSLTVPPVRCADSRAGQDERLGPRPCDQPTSDANTARRAKQTLYDIINLHLSELSAAAFQAEPTRLVARKVATLVPDLVTDRPTSGRQVQQGVKRFSVEPALPAPPTSFPRGRKRFTVSGDLVPEPTSSQPAASEPDHLRLQPKRQAIRVDPGSATRVIIKAIDPFTVKRVTLFTTTVMPPGGMPLTQKGVIPGLLNIPKGVEFSCKHREDGFYANKQTGCQVYHQCTTDGKKYDYMCGVGTVFNEKSRTCDHWYNARCDRS